MRPNTDARMASAAELSAVTGARTHSSIYLGRYYDSENDRAGDEIPYNGERHLLIFGPNGSGKGTRFLIPNLLNGLEDRSVIVIDPKGELAAVTADHRRRLGHDVVILNPFGVLEDLLGESAGFNPLASLDPQSPYFYDDAAAIGEALIKIEGTDPHWSESAQGLLIALIMWEKIRNGDDANLKNVRSMLTEPNDWKTVIGEDGKPKEKQIAGLQITANYMVARGGYEVESLASRFISVTREVASIQSAADTQTRWMLSPPMREDLRKEGVNFAKLKDRPTTVYVVLPAERLRTHSVWLRLVIVSALRALYRPGGRRVLMLIDEMAALGHLAPLEDAFGLVRGYRVQVAAIFQDLGQLKQLYKERWETFVANAGVVFGFAPNDLTTADWMSRRAGQTTIVAKGFSQNIGTSTGERTSSNMGSGTSDQQIARPLYLPHELFGFEEGMGLLWLAGLGNGARFFAPSYWKIGECKARAKPNPYYTED
jgi:type IV secretion system protein VirD4